MIGKQSQLQVKTKVFMNSGIDRCDEKCSFGQEGIHTDELSCIDESLEGPSW